MFKFFSFFHSQNQKRKSIHKSNSYYFHSNPPNHPPGDFVTWCCLHLCHPSTTKWYYSTHTAKQPSQPSTSSWNLGVTFKSTSFQSNVLRFVRNRLHRIHIIRAVSTHATCFKFLVVEHFFTPNTMQIPTEIVFANGKRPSY